MISKSITTLLLAITALTGAPHFASAADEPGPSPLVTFDKTRLWILGESIGMSPESKCSKYFRMPNNPLYQGDKS